MIKQFSMLAVFLLSTSIFAQEPELLDNSLSQKAIPMHTEIMTPGSYIAGGVVGTVLGLGIGHAIQGRYKEIGWVFTVGDTFSYVGLIASSALMSNGNVSPVTGSVILLVSSLMLSGFRIWETVDVWASPVNRVQWHATTQEKPANRISLVEPIPTQEIAIPVINMAF